MAHCLGKPAPRLARLLRRVAEHDRVNAEFNALLPADMRGHCRVATYRDRKVLLHVDSAAWATRLRYLLPDLTVRSELLAAADKLRVKVRPPVSEAPLAHRPPVRLSTQSAKLLLDYGRSLGDDDLARSLRRLARHAGQKKAEYG